MSDLITLWALSDFSVFAAYDSKYGNCWPLHHTYKLLMATNRAKLVELLELNERLTKALIQEDCISVQQYQHIQKSGDKIKQNEEFLNVLATRSNGHFHRFIVCLSRTQPHLTPLLTGYTGKYFV